MHLTALSPIGAEVSDLSLAALDATLVATLRALLAEHGVLVLRDQPIDDATFEAFLRSFGPLVFTAGETPLAGHPDLNVVSNVGRTSPPRSQFHVDTSYVSQPPAYTALRAVEVPREGGATLFTNQYRAYDTLPETERERLADCVVTHVVTGVDPGAEQETSAQHPLFRRHPLSGRTSLYLSTQQRCVAVSGMEPVEAEATVAWLLAHSTTDDNTLRHAWAPGDVVIWDNACVLHRADHDGVVGDRVMHRGMVAAHAPA